MNKVASNKLQVAGCKVFGLPGCYWFTLLLATFTLPLVSCGFHLRGAYQLPPQMATTMIRADNMNSELVRSLKRSLETSGITIVDQLAASNSNTTEKSSVTVLRIVKESHNKRILSVDAKGRVREYELHYRIGFELTAADDYFLPEQTLELSRDFLFDPEDVLGKSDEEAELLRDMQQDMVRLIMLRLQAVAQKNSSAVQSLPVQ